FGKGVYVTDGGVLKRLDPYTDTAVTAPEIRLRGTGDEAVDMAAPDLQSWFVLTRDATQTRWTVTNPTAQLQLPADFAASRLVAARGVVWVTGTLHGRMTVLVLEVRQHGMTVARTMRIADTTDSDLVFVSPRTALLTSRGSVYRVRLPG